MKISFLILTFLVASSGILFAQQAGEPEGEKTTTASSPSVCVTCHLDTEVDYLMDPVVAHQQIEEDRLVDVHARSGISCHDCHGGNPTDESGAKDEGTGFAGAPGPTEIPQFCGRCHSDIEYMREHNPHLPTDQVREYATSVHGKKLAEGDEKVATCVSCHGSHGIRSIKEPGSSAFASHVPETCGKCHADPEYMKEYEIPTNQVEGYKKSRHGRMLLEEGDITSPTCNDCHGNHGAVPPGVAAVHHVCGQCHARQLEFFEKSTHARAFQELGKPGCVTCHGNHEIPTPTEKMMSNQPGSACITCHATGDECYRAVGRMQMQFAALKERRDSAEQLLDHAERLGMGVEKAKFSLATEASDHLTKARILIHQFRAEVVEEELGKGIVVADQAAEAGNEALEEWEFRRKGLGVSLVLILLTISALLLKIRTLKP